MTQLNLYLLTQSDNRTFEFYDSCVVCAESETDAFTITPDLNNKVSDKCFYTSWAKEQTSITCKEIGQANKDQIRGIILASFIYIP